MPQAAPLRAAVAGATGYIGMQCTALLDGHPGVELVSVLGRSSAGSRYCDVVPGSAVELVIEDSLDPGAADVVVAALPHTVAARFAGGWLSHGATVIDCSADFRLHDAEAYRAWYGVDHPSPELLGEAVYAMVELDRERLARREPHLGAGLLSHRGAARLRPRAARAPRRARRGGRREEWRQRRGTRGDAREQLLGGERVGARVRRRGAPAQVGARSSSCIARPARMCASRSCRTSSR